MNGKRMHGRSQLDLKGVRKKQQNPSFKDRISTIGAALKFNEYA
jgi:hypothetical protein